MHIGGLVPIKRFINSYLSRRVVDEVGASDDMIDAAVMIINDNSQLISKKAVGAFDDKIAHFFFNIL